MNLPEKHPSIGWAWDVHAEGDGGAEAEGPGGARYVFEPEPEPHVTRTGPSGWSAPVPPRPGLAAAMVADERRVYVALYSRGATGCTVVALDAGSGEQVWETPLIGLGSVGHSKYANRVQVRLDADELIIYGKESAGRYTEILDAADGSRLAHEAVRD